MFINIITLSKNIPKQQNTITSQLLQYACVHLQLDHSVWNFVEEEEILVNRVTADSKIM